MKDLYTLNHFFWNYKWRFLLGIVFIFCSNLFGVLAPEIVGQAMDLVKDVILIARIGGDIGDIQIPEFILTMSDVLGRDLAGELSSKPDLRTTAYWLAGFLAVLYLIAASIKGLFTFLMRQTIIIMSRLIEYDLKNAVFAHYQKLDRGFYKRNATGDLMNRISEDVSAVRMYLGPAIMYTINTLVLFILVISFMVKEDVELTLYALVPLPIMTVIVYLVSDVINRKSQIKQEQQSALSSVAQETFSGIRVFKAYHRESSAVRKFRSGSDTYRFKALSLAKTNALFMPSIILLIGLSTVLTIYVGGMKVINGQDGVTVGDIAKFVIYVNMLTWPFASVGWVTSLVQQASASMKRINEFLQSVPTVEAASDGVKPTIEGEIRFERVSFTYPDTGIQALTDVSFHVPAGSSLAIVGHTGSGKSTISELITRQYDPEAGKVLLDGLDLKKINLDHFHRQLGYVPQDVFLFSDTIARNIGFTLDDVKVNRSAIESAAKDAQVHDDILGFPNGYETLLGERGVTLSGGQKQRVSIARALVRKPRILIFDDPLSAVDTQTEEAILHALERVMKDRTTIMISHRISAIQHADNIIVLKDGMIVQQGRHSDLILAKGPYAELYEQQLLEAADS
jgi:ATP-binding cassette subfamily B protein